MRGSRSPHPLLGSQLCQGLSGRDLLWGPDLQASAAPTVLATFELEAAQVSSLLFLPHVTSVFSCLDGETEAKEGTGQHHFSGQEAPEQTGEDAKVDVGPLLSLRVSNPSSSPVRPLDGCPFFPSCLDLHSGGRDRGPSLAFNPLSCTPILVGRSCSMYY